jgi:CRISPR-associated endonuclease Cas2
MSHILVLYDVPDDSLRDRLCKLLQDRGLEKLQLSAYLGRASRGRRNLIIQEIAELIDLQTARVHVIPLSSDLVEDIAVVSNYPFYKPPRP